MYINPRGRNTKRPTIVPIMGICRLKPQSPEWTHRADEAFGGAFEEVTSLQSALRERSLNGHSRTTHSPRTAFCYRALHPLLRVDLAQIQPSSLYFRILSGNPYPRKGRRVMGQRLPGWAVLDKPKGSGVKGRARPAAARHDFDSFVGRHHRRPGVMLSSARRSATVVLLIAPYSPAAPASPLPTTQRETWDW
jgi:hypothetical protein